MKSYKHNIYCLACKVVAILYINALALNPDAVAADSDSALAALKDALSHKDQLTTLHTVQMGSANSISIKEDVYSKVGPDGFTLSRIEIRPTGAGTADLAPTISIVNRDGYWDVSGKKTILMKFASVNAGVAAQTREGKNVPIDESNKYQTTNVSYLAKPCVKITMTLSDVNYDQEADRKKAIIDALVNAAVRPPASVRIPQAADTVAYIYEYTIDPATKSLMAFHTYTKGGDLLQSDDYSVVDENPALSQDLFEIPKGAKIVTALNTTEYINFKMER